MQSNENRKYYIIDESAQELLQIYIAKLGLSARINDRIFIASQTIADLAGSEQILPEYVAEAIQCRNLDR